MVPLMDAWFDERFLSVAARDHETARPRAALSLGLAAVLAVVAGWVPAHYDRIGMAEIPRSGPTRYRWGEVARDQAPQEASYVFVYRRREPPESPP